MTVTTHHYASRAGRPVCLDDDGHLIQDHVCLQRFIRQRRLTEKQAASLFLAGESTVRRWQWGGRALIPIRVLNILRHMLEDEREYVLSMRLPALSPKNKSNILHSLR